MKRHLLIALASCALLACGPPAPILTGRTEIPPGTIGTYFCTVAPGAEGVTALRFDASGELDAHEVATLVLGSRSAVFNLAAPREWTSGPPNASGAVDVSCSAESGGRWSSAAELTVLVGDARPGRQLVVTEVPGVRVTSRPSGIDCPGVCAADFAHDSDVVLTAALPARRKVRGWRCGTGDVTAGPIRMSTDLACSLELGLDEPGASAGLSERWFRGPQPGTDVPARLAWSADGTSLFVLSSAGISELDADTGTLRRTLFPDESIDAFEVMPDGTFVLLSGSELVLRRAGDDGRRVIPAGASGAELVLRGSPPRAVLVGSGGLTIVDVTTGSVDTTPALPVSGADFVSPSDRWVMSDRALFDVATGSAVLPLDRGPDGLSHLAPTHAAWSPDETLVATTFPLESPSLALWDTTTGQYLDGWTLAEAVLLAGLGDRPVVALEGYGGLLLVDLTTGAVIARGAPHLDSAARVLRASPDGSKLALEAGAGELSVWSVTP